MKLPNFLNYVFGGPPISQKEEPQTVRALPGQWYISQEMYELERRAIFARKWLMITHSSRLKQSGQWLRYDIAGFSLVLTRERAGDIIAFHDVCRHCTSAVVATVQEGGNIPRCECQGSRAELDASEDQAPLAQDIRKDFFTIHVHVDAKGFIWLNLDAGETPENKWEDDFNMIDRQERHDYYNFDEYEYDHTWQMETGYNWKLAADNYNECYHCKTTHPDLPALADLGAYSVDVKDGYIIHNVATTAEQAAAGLRVAPTWYLPAASMNVMSNFFFIQKAMPHGPDRTTMNYEVYRHKDATDEDFDQVNQMYKRVMSEDKALCEAAQKNINAGVFLNGELHPRLEKGPLYFQKFVREVVTQHWKEEQTLRRQIWPAEPTLQDIALH